MTCAKVKVSAVYRSPGGIMFRGTNKCDSPQETCPRLPGEDYKKCLDICRQPYHAETAALSQADRYAKEKDAGYGGHMVVYYDRVCEECQRIMTGRNITWETRPMQKQFKPGQLIFMEKSDINGLPIIPIPEDKGLRYNEGKPRHSLVSQSALAGLISVLEFGAKKYGENNWQKGIGCTSVLDSLMRHVSALYRGEENDAESGLPHIDHVQCNAMFLAHYLHDPEKYRDFNDLTGPRRETL